MEPNTFTFQVLTPPETVEDIRIMTWTFREMSLIDYLEGPALLEEIKNNLFANTPEGGVVTLRKTTPEDWEANEAHCSSDWEIFRHRFTGWIVKFNGETSYPGWELPIYNSEENYYFIEAL